MGCWAAVLMIERFSRWLGSSTLHDPDGSDRNKPCRCGSGKKYKRCCLAEDEREWRDALGVASRSTDMRPSASPYRTKPTRSRSKPQTAWSRLLGWLSVAALVAMLGLFGIMWGRSWLGMNPYGGKVDGTIVTKNTVVHQSRYGTRLEYFVTVSSKAGLVHTAVPWGIYSIAVPGSTFHQQQNVFQLTSADGHRATKITVP